MPDLRFWKTGSLKNEPIIKQYPVVFKSLCNGDDIVVLVVSRHPAHQADRKLVVLTVELQLLLVLLAHIQTHSQAWPVPDGRGHAAHAGTPLAVLGHLQRTFVVPHANPRGRVHGAGSAHTIHDVAQERVGSQFPGARLSTLRATRELVRLSFPALDDAHLAEVVPALKDHGITEEFQTHRAGELRL